MMSNKGWPITPSFEECLRAHRISIGDYRNVILALFQAASKDSAARMLRRFDRTGYPISSASVLRKFDGFTIAAEDRGPLYAVWLKRTQEDGSVEEVLEFAEFPWGEIYP